MGSLDVLTKQRDVDRSMKRKSSIAALFGGQNGGRKDARMAHFALVSFLSRPVTHFRKALVCIADRHVAQIMSLPKTGIGPTFTANGSRRFPAGFLKNTSIGG